MVEMMIFSPVLRIDSKVSLDSVFIASVSEMTFTLVFVHGQMETIKHSYRWFQNGCFAHFFPLCFQTNFFDALVHIYTV